MLVIYTLHSNTTLYITNYSIDKCHCSKLSTPTVHIYNQITVSTKYILYKTVVGALNKT